MPRNSEEGAGLLKRCPGHELLSLRCWPDPASQAGGFQRGLAGAGAVAVTLVLLLEEVAETKGMGFAGSHKMRTQDS